MEYHFTAVLESSSSKVWMRHFIVPEKYVKKLTADDGSRRVVCKLNNTIEFQCGIISVIKGKFGCMVNKPTCKKLGIDTGDAVHVQLKPDESEYGLPMPEEFAELLRYDNEADTYFHALTAGKQRTLLYIINTAKTSEKRIEKSVVVANHLVKNKGKVNYKELYSSLKPNARIE